MMATGREADGHTLQELCIAETNHGEGCHLDNKPKGQLSDSMRLNQLAEGFYEIEAVRHRRLQKGQRQYLIKWRGWPETSNTWEPLENLLSCSDVIEDFEKRFVPKKPGRRKKKPEDGRATQPKRKYQSTVTFSPRKRGRLNAKAMDESLPNPNRSDTIDLVSPPKLNNSETIDAHSTPPDSNGTHGYVEEDHMNMVNHYTKISDRSMSTTGPKDVRESDGFSNDDVLTNGVTGDKSAVYFYETKSNGTCGHVEKDHMNMVNHDTTKISEGSMSTTGLKDARGSDGFSNDDVITNDVMMDKPDMDFLETKDTQGGPFMKEFPMLGFTEHGLNCMGSRRRKSGSVKRFQRDAVRCSENGNPEDSTAQISNLSEAMQSSAFTCYTSGCNNKFDGSKSSFQITDIVKPIFYSPCPSDNMQGVSITFMARRSDGIEVMVDNTYLKNNYPLLLINFYEKHLRYTPTP